VARWPLPQAARPDFTVVDRLARLQVAARRIGCSVRLQDASDELRELLDLAGLARAAGADRPSVVEMGGEPEC